MIPIRLIVVISLLGLPVTASAGYSVSSATVADPLGPDVDRLLSVFGSASVLESSPREGLPESPRSADEDTDTAGAPANPSWSDTDSDGLDDRLELSLGTNATDPDTDGDGLDDWDEVVRYETDPAIADTDGDRIADGTERRLGLDPTDPDPLASPDEDGRSFSADSDGDGLADELERRIGTDPLVKDTDGDSFSDGVEVYASPRILPGADPLRKDLYFEVDAYHTVTVNRTALTRTAEFFASAPVENPDGTTGFEVHFVVDETNLTTLSAANVHNHETVIADFDRQNRGYLYIFLTESVSIGERRVRASANYGRIAMDGREQSDRLYVHEIGHLLGVHGHDGPGVDTYETSIEEYPSIMSYTYLNSNHTVRMATGDESPKSNDDWEDIRNRFTRWIDTSGFESHSGEVESPVSSRVRAPVGSVRFAHSSTSSRSLTLA
ncbi:hypothetical protein C453_18295 [Haloferax elongans ATCC BAA-1513]|uniref:Matrixin n=1 Tax=Haloferax elongans ATCC BAA-1513 TaxID=1230453 RepID=M0HCW3_HALEO|nr:hypothetical protein [Haloferax elongans]ELZ80914.1 hypothetical protein C453_18295 [Haloferax elongans ATCC BAA-1513]